MELAQPFVGSFFRAVLLPESLRRAFQRDWLLQWHLLQHVFEHLCRYWKPRQNIHTHVMENDLHAAHNGLEVAILIKLLITRC